MAQDLHGISKVSVQRIIKHVSASLGSKSGQFIRFPPSNCSHDGVKKGFYNYAKFFGAVEDSHIKIKVPKDGGSCTSTESCITATIIRWIFYL